MSIDSVKLSAIQTAVRSAAAQTNTTLAGPTPRGLPQTGDTPAAVYHGSQRYTATNPLNETGVTVYARLLCTPEEEANRDQIMTLLTTGLASASANLRRASDAAMALLPPELLEKDWGFSVLDGELILIQGKDILSDEDRAALHAAFDRTAVEEASRQVADTIITALKYDREWGADDVTLGIGRFDVSEKNFGDIVDLRAYLDEFGAEGRYGKNLIDPTDYESLYFVGGYAMMEMIAARAEPRFAGRECDSVEWNTTRIVR
jgi:hypothetical protein